MVWLMGQSEFRRENVNSRKGRHRERQKGQTDPGRQDWVFGLQGTQAFEAVIRSRLLIGHLL